jgi:mono/diheme cytochrome c family protein
MPTRLLIALFLTLAAASGADTSHPGATIYKSQCASCHGNLGEGVPGKFDEPLTGDRSLDACAYLVGHGFKNARALRGGIDAYAKEADPSLPRYQLEFED